MHNKSMLKQRLMPLISKKGIKLVILFGSRAKGSNLDRSDYDLALMQDESFDIIKMTMEICRVLETDKVDIIDIRQVSPLLGMEIAKYGKIIFESKPGLFNSFKSLIFRKYCDTKKIRDARKESIKSFLEKGIA